MPRILYIDVPFANEAGGDKNRSRFLWHALGQAFDTDLLLLRPAHPAPDATSAPPPPPHPIPPVLELTPGRARCFDSDSVLGFAGADLARFDHLLAERRYDAVFTRFHAPWFLARRAERHPSRPAVIVDLDMLSSRLVGLTWRQEPSLRHRWFLVESLKLARLERQLVRQPWLVLFSNPSERDHVLARVAPPTLPGRLEVLPNTMPDPPATPTPPPGRDLLFFGSLNSAANTDACRHLLRDLLPLLEPDLRQYDARIRIVGKNPPPWLAELVRQAGSDRVLLVGGVPSMEEAIAESRFVFLPLRVASGTRTRILEAAAVRRAVVTTPLGAEGIDVGSDALLGDDAPQLAAAARRLLEDPALPAHLGQRLHDRCRALYSRPVVADALVAQIRDFLASRRPDRPPR